MIQGLFFRRISRRLAEVEVQGHIFEAYESVDKGGETIFRPYSTDDAPTGR